MTYVYAVTCTRVKTQRRENDLYSVTVYDLSRNNSSMI